MTAEGQTDIIDAADVKALVVDSPLVRYATEKMQAMAVEEVARAKQDTALLQRTGAQWVTAAEPDQVAVFVRAAVSVGLNVLVGDAFLIHGGFFVSIQGRRKLAGLVLNRAGDPVMRGESPPRELTDAEFVLHGIREGDMARIVDIFRSDRDFPGQGVGIVRKSEIREGGKLPVQDRPEFMAAKRAAAAAYRVAFPDLAAGTAEFDDSGRLVASDVTGQAIDGGVLPAPADTPALPEGVVEREAEEQAARATETTPSDDGTLRIAEWVEIHWPSTTGVIAEHILGCSIPDWLAASDIDEAASLIDDVRDVLMSHEGMELSEAVSRTHAARAAADLYYRNEAITNPVHMSEAAAAPALPLEL